MARCDRRVISGFLLAAILAMSAVILAACSIANPPAQSGDELSRANYLIDQKQYSEAIFILTDRLKKTPADRRARILLASAYASRAGVSFSSFHNLAVEIDKWNRSNEMLGFVDASVLDTVTKVLVRIQILIRAFDAIPVPANESAATDLTLALTTLDQGGALSGGPALFRALLRVVIFKKNLTGLYRPVITLGCRITAKDLSAWVSAIGLEAGKIVDDVGYGMSDIGAKQRTLDFGMKLKASVTDVLAFAGKFAGASIELPAELKKVYGACE